MLWITACVLLGFTDPYWGQKIPEEPGAALNYTNPHLAKELRVKICSMTLTC